MTPTALFDLDNLFAWCIVPYDGQRRSPGQRAAMLQRLGLHKFVYDYREEHLPSFSHELDALEAHGIELTGTCVGTGPLQAGPAAMLAEIGRRGLHPEIWYIQAGNEVLPLSQLDHDGAKKWTCEMLKPTLDVAGELGCRVGLYNHGGWFGEPENQVQIIETLGRTDVGMVYNFHHGHRHVARFAELFSLMQPHLLALNVNGMVEESDPFYKKILPLGQGSQELAMMRTVLDSGWQGPVGIINHTHGDAEIRLRDNLNGLLWLSEQLTRSSDRPRPGCHSLDFALD